MTFDFDLISTAVRGAVQVYEEGGKLCFCRFTKEQMEAYRGYSDDFHMKAHASAGIRLEFSTDSKRLCLFGECRLASSRHFAGFDIYANGALVCHKLVRLVDGYARYELSTELPTDGEKQVIIYFPWSAAANIESLTLDDGASFTPTKRPHKMICFGDSITHGYDAINPSFSYANRLADALCADHINKGIGGEVFFPTLAELKDDITPDIITVAYGTNDWSKNTLSVFDRNSALFYEKLSKSYPEAKIFALSPIWRINCETRMTEVGDFRYVAEKLQEIALTLKNVTFIDCFDFVPHSESCFIADVLHPNDAGFYHYATNLYAKIKDLI